MTTRDRNLAIFTATTLASGWLGVAANRLTGQADSLDSIGSLIWIATPLATTLALRAAGTGWRQGGFSPRLPTTLPWYIVGALLFPVVTAGVVGLGRLAGWVDVSALEPRRFAIAAGSALAGALIKNVFEEAVWRGFLTEELLATRTGDLRLNLSVGAVWGLWHLPYYLYFLDAESMRAVLDIPRLPFALLATAVMIGWTVPYTELYRLTRSIWPCVVAHGVEDAFVNPLVIDGHIRMSPGRAALVSPIVGVITTAAYVGVGLVLRLIRRRRGRRGRGSTA